MTKERANVVAQMVRENGFECEVREVVKTNGTKVGICMTGVTISPTVYLVDEYTDKQNMEMVCELFSRNDANDLNVDSLMQEKNIRGVVVNTVNNAKLLENAPHISFLDLSIVFKYVKDELSTLINNSVADNKGYSVDDLMEIATKNSKSMIMPIMDIIAEGMDIDEADAEVLADNPMIVVSNKEKTFGAFNGFDKKNLEKLAKKYKSDLYIIPSSIHECIIVKADDHNADELRMLIEMVNMTEVKPEEVLSFSLYMYDRNAKEIVLA